MSEASNHVRLTPELQAEYQQIYNDPARLYSREWYIAAKGLFAAGLIIADPGSSADAAETLTVADSLSNQQSL